MCFLSKRFINQFLRYLATGGLAFVVDFGLFTLCLYALEYHYLVSNLIGLIAGLLLNYAISVSWVFADSNRTFEQWKSIEFLIFAIVGFAGVGINQLMMLLMVGALEWQEILSKMIAAIVVLMWNFGARKFFLFKGVKQCPKI